jgi:carbamoyl-phosphate synthase large subunit
LTKIDWWFLNKLSGLIAYEVEIAAKELTPELIFEIKRKGFTDRAVAEIRTLAWLLDLHERSGS